MSCPNLMAEIEMLRQALRNTKERGKRKSIKKKLKALNEKKERYEIAYYGKVLG